jgi:hypothetical protein
MYAAAAIKQFVRIKLWSVKLWKVMMVMTILRWKFFHQRLLFEKKERFKAYYAFNMRIGNILRDANQMVGRKWKFSNLTSFNFDQFLNSGLLRSYDKLKLGVEVSVAMSFELIRNFPITIVCE